MSESKKKKTEIEKLKEEKKRIEEELAEATKKQEQIEHQLQRAENRADFLKDNERRRRTHRLVIKGAIIDQHFLKRSRENRLFSVAFDNPECVCIGIDEATALVVTKGREIEVIGRSSVMVIEPDPKSIRVDKNYNYAGKAKVRLLFEGDKFKLKR